MKSATKTNEEWIKVLGKGMITIPKKWRVALSIDAGNLVKARKDGDSLIIEPANKSVSYRIYSQKELENFITDDQIRTS
ncbi:MAG: Uncharacterized protein Athens101428_349 [Candidatus Berkelbacteria bacterium Athens1014_28]|uniref:SpoVT-AbrB domain-containing protein n=1 Tax=Candidatus Berkelbacteria bacterium Athens1014_28 TaxID=2017145 RepID=A0A554LN45_9BACT|nr:MAG: Uncharacterized protein Athens101428_349 [Candidatus Berkelbacteria bacterium Athens1014_28]